MPKSGFPPPVRRSSSPTSSEDTSRSERTKWYLLLGALSLLAVAGGAVILNNDESSSDADTTQPTEVTVLLASEPPVPPTIAVDPVPPTVPATVATTISATTIAATTVPATVPPTAPPTLPTTVPSTVPSTVAPLAPGPRLEVADATGSFVVLLPADFQTNIEPVTLGGIDMNQVSGAINIDRYLAGDFSVLGATVLTGPVAEIGTPGDFLARFEFGRACTLSNTENDVSTAKGKAVVLSYDRCGGGDDSMILIAVEDTELQQIEFVGLQAPEPDSERARDLAIGILESLRRA